MELSNNSKQTIADELAYVAKRVREEENINKKIFVFSASYAIIQRIFNLEFDPELILIHNTLISTYTSINSRLKSIITGEERVIELPEGLLNGLADAVEDLRQAIIDNDDIYKALQKIANIGYVTTGNGYYLYQKGILKIPTL